MTFSKGNSSGVSGAATDQHKQLIVVGWLIVNKLDEAEANAVAQGRAQMLELLQRQFSQFQWQMPVVERTEPVQSAYQEPVVLLDEGRHERDIQHWDYAFVVTRTDLKSYYKPYAIAVPSRAMNVAIMSLARLSAQPPSSPAEGQEFVSRVAARVCALGLHLFGDLNGVPHCDDPTAFMYAPESSDELDQMTHYAQIEHARLTKELAEVADIRLEEQPANERGGMLHFFVKATWIGRDAIASAIIQAKPWEFPFRLSRLTTAAISTLLILLVTAEAWELGMSQPPLVVSGFSLLTLLATSGYILKRHKLLLRRGGRRLTEQTVVTNVSMSLVVLLGMATTYLLLFLVTLLLSRSLFNHTLIEGWAASLSGKIETEHYLVLAAFVASLGILIGALGASIEGQSYFRHIAYVDEET